MICLIPLLLTEPLRRRRRPLRPVLVASEAEPQAMDARRVVAVVLTALLLAGLGGADAITQTAEAQPFGWKRTLGVRLAAPLRAVSHAFALDLPRRGIEAALNFEFGRSPDELSSRRVVASGGGPIPAPPPVAAGSISAAQVAAPVPRPAANAPGFPALDRPMSMYVAGDSVSGHLGGAMRGWAGRHDMAAEAEFRVSSGLLRPDVFDWPRRIAERTDELNPRAVVLMFGANDNHHMRGKPFGSDAWRADYAGRVGAILDRLVASGREVYWVGQPVMRDPVFADHMRIVNDIYRAEASKRPGVVYVDAWTAFVDGEGNYTDWLPDETGNLVKVRAGDGIHLTGAGGQRLAAYVLHAMDARNPAPPPPATPAPAAPPPEEAPPPDGGSPPSEPPTKPPPETTPGPLIGVPSP